MPFKSDAQRRFMHAKHPEIAKRWRRKYGPQRDLPERRHAPMVDGMKRAGKRKDN